MIWLPPLPSFQLTQIGPPDTSNHLNESPFLIQDSRTIFDNALAGKSPATYTISS